MSHRACSLPLLVLGAAGLLHSQTAPLPTLSVTPTTVSFSYTIGTTTLPAPQTLQIKRSGSGNPLDFTATVTGAAPWLIVTPTSGKTGTSISVRVNSTSLNAGTYAAVLQVDAVGAAAPVTASIVLTIRNPPPTMTAAPGSLSFTWQTDATTPPADQTVAVTTSGEPFSFSVAVAGGTWLSVTPTIAVALSGSAVTLTAKADTTGMTPGTYTGRITLSSLTAANKTITVGVTLTVSPGTAVISSIWPSVAPIGSNDTTITVRGDHLFKASVVRAGTTDLSATWVSSNVILAALPKALLATQGTLQITVLNSPQPASNQVAFTVTPPGPIIQTIVNAASFQVDTGKPQLAPGEIITIFGAALGPNIGLIATPGTNGYPTSVGTPPTLVEFEIGPNWVAAPLIFAQANQINCQVPFALLTGTDRRMRVTYNSLVSAAFLFDAVAAAPGVFTVDSSGRGQAAALNFDPLRSSYSLNSAANPAPKGGVLILYLTGTGALSTPPNPEGALIPASPLPTVGATPSVTIGGDAASVISATAVPGALGGLTQINVNVPTSARTAKDLSVVVSVAGRATPVTATVAVK